MRRLALYFNAPGIVEVREEECPPPGAGEFLVRTLLSALSPGTEMLLYRGQVPGEISLDATIPGMQRAARYPLKYGYCCVGEIVGVGPGADPVRLGEKVFAFHPHESFFTAPGSELMPIPPGVETERAVFLPNLETALNFVQDARPLVGEFAGVWGLGIVGLLTCAVLGQFPLAGVVGFDRLPLRRASGLASGLDAALDPLDDGGWQEIRQAWEKNGMRDGFDLIFEVSGAPSALNQAISRGGFTTRVVIGSWYGTKPVQLELGGGFHRSRMQLVASQVSSIAPDLMGRWTKERRFHLAWQQLERIRPEKWITQRIPFIQSGQAYEQLADDPSGVIQIVFEYE